ncbi:MAG: hypothetical protein FWF59_14495 [Turicibacter sp.]|nr:hypothetical protein [Turicibacter sp.]
MAQQEAAQPKIKSKVPTDPAKIRLQKQIRRAMFRKRLYQFYVLLLVVLTGAFAYHVFNYFVLQHNETAGIPEFGNRLEYLEEIPPSLFESSVAFGLGLPGVESLTIENPHNGVVVFFDLRVSDGTELGTAQATAQQIANHFREAAGDLLEGYNLQLVVSRGDIAALATQNREASIEAVYEHFYFLADTTVTHAEEFPTESNISRAQTNINNLNSRFNNQEFFAEQAQPDAGARVGELQGRLDAIVPWTPEELEAALEQHNNRLPDVLQGVERLVPRTNVNDFPSWGIINRETGEFQWN